MPHPKIELAIILANQYLKEYTKEELEQLAFDSPVDRLSSHFTEEELCEKVREAGLELLSKN